MSSEKSRIFPPTVADEGPPPEAETRPGIRRRERAPRSFVRWLIPLAALILLGATLCFVFFPHWLFPSAPELVPIQGRLALLPFVNQTGETENTWIRLGLMEMVTETLRANRGVDILSPLRLTTALERRDLLDSDVAGARARVRQLAFDLGADLVLDATASRSLGSSSHDGERQAVYTLEYDLHAPGQPLTSGEVSDRDPAGLGAALANLLARSLVPGSQPVSMRQALSRSAFLNRLYGMGLAEMRQSPELARSYFAICLHHQADFLLAKARLASCERDLGNLEQAESLQLEVLQESQKRADQALQGRTLVALAELAEAQGRSEESRRLYAQSSSIWLSLGDDGAQLEVVDALVDRFIAEGAIDRATELLSEELAAHPDSKDLLGRAGLLLRLGELHLDGADLDRAEPFLEEARQIAVDLGDAWIEHRVITALGRVAESQRDLETAEQSWQQALTFYEQHGDREQQRDLTLRLAELYLGKNELDRAEELFHRLRDLALADAHLPSEGLASLRLAQVLLRKGYPRQARTHLQRALELDGVVGQRITLQLTIAWLAYEQGNYRLAVDTQQAAKRQAERWGAVREAYLQVFEQALKENRRLPLPGEQGFQGDAG